MEKFDRHFSFVSPLVAFEKSSAAGGEKRRIAGVISTESKDDDLKRETVLQDGLDFGPFMKSGVFNDDHGKETANILGYPSHVEIFQKGARLPDDTFAHTKLSWAEGWLLQDYEPADKIWNLAKALAKSKAPRSLGFSVEGSILARSAFDRSIVTKGVVDDCAITRKAINQGSRLHALAKSLTAAAMSGVLTAESLDPVLQTRLPTLLSERKRKQASLSKSEAVAYVASRLPTATPEQVHRIIALVERHQKGS